MNGCRNDPQPGVIQGPRETDDPRRSFMFNHSRLRLILYLATFFLVSPIACNGGSMNQELAHYEKLSDVPEAAWQKLASRKIYFGHQSVGYNIIDGVSEIIKENHMIQLAVEENYNPAEYKAGVISHSRIGYNEDPKSKLDMFSFLVKSGGAQMADIMFFKFCYVDFSPNTDEKALFRDYESTFKQLKAKYPQVIFVHLTVPLTCLQQGSKAWIKKLIGRPIAGMQENAKRHAFNELLRQTYAGKEPFFDIAAIESTFPDGNRATYEYNGTTNYLLVQAYTSDGAHLSEVGKRVVATQLLLTLAGIP